MFSRSSQAPKISRLAWVGHSLITDVTHLEPHTQHPFDGEFATQGAYRWSKAAVSPIKLTRWVRYKKLMARINRLVRRRCRTQCKSQMLYSAVIVLVSLNTLTLVSGHYKQLLWLDDFQESCNRFPVTLFTYEVFLKMYSLGLQGYFVSLFNRFDCVAVISSILELLLTNTELIMRSISASFCTYLR